MKKHIHKKIGIFALAIIMIVGCTEFIDKVDNFKIGITSEIFEQNAVIQLKDYHGNQEDISNTDFNIVFSGADADKLVNEAGEFVITATQGFIQLNVNPNKSQGVKELNFDLTISGGPYKETTYPITLKDTISLIQLSLVNENKLILNTDEVDTDVSLANNAIVASVTVKTANLESVNATTVTVDAGTQFKDATGAAITGSDLNIQVNNTDQFSDLLKNLEDVVFKDENGLVVSNKSADLIFGKTQISMDLNGTAVKEFTDDIAVAIKISSKATNPITGTTVQVGDTFPIYTNNEGTSEWTYHGVGTVMEGDTAFAFDILFETTHLSNYAVVNFIDTACSEYGYNITAPNLAADYTASFAIKMMYKKELVTTSGDLYSDLFEEYFPDKERYREFIREQRELEKPQYLDLFYVDIVNGEITNVDEVIVPGLKSTWSNNLNGISKLLESGQDTLVTNTYVNFVIGDGFYKEYYQLSVTWNDYAFRTNLSDIATYANCQLAINLTQDLTQIFEVDNLKNINIDVAANCNGNNLVPDGFPIYVERADGSFSYEGTIKKGKVTLNGFELNKEYNFKTMYKGKFYTNKWTFTSTDFIDHNFKIPDSVCNEIGF